MLNKGIVNISGISDSRVAAVAAKIIEEKEGRHLIIVSSEARASRLLKDLSFFVPSRAIYEFPSSEEIYMHYDAKSHDVLLRQQKILKAVCQDESCIVIAPVMGAMKKLAPVEVSASSVVRLSVGTDVDLDGLRSSLVSMGYECVPTIDGRGQYAVRGSIIDIFTPEADNPYRIELFDTEVDSVRTFNLFTQRSVDQLDKVEIYPAEHMIRDDEVFENAAVKIEKEYDRQIKKQLEKGFERVAENLANRRDELTELIRNGSNLQQLENYITYFYDEPDTLFDYMEGATLMVDDPNNVMRYYEERCAGIKNDFSEWLREGRVVREDLKNLPGKGDLQELYHKVSSLYLFTPFANRVKGVETFDEIVDLPSKATASFNGQMDVLRKELVSYVEKDYEITLVCSSDERLSNMREFLDRSGLKGKVRLAIGTLSSGMDFPTKKVCYIWDGDIFVTGRKSIRRRKKEFRTGEAIRSFADMKKGDFVVHEAHGIGKFLGIEQLTVLGAKRDYLKIKYAGTDMLYVPVEQMDVVQKYVGAESASPKLSKLSGADWKVTKMKAKIAVAEMAQKLLDTQAQRQLEPGYQFPPDSNWQVDFEEMFPYVETNDQLRAVDEIKGDMEMDSAMDRLLCGDVGYGKTEVAARAMFKCASNGKQVAVLVPTTILASQHYYTLKDRFEKFPLSVEMLSRFRSGEQQKEIAGKLAEGKIDVVIGTHRLLSKDIKFKDLGLLVIDEEQRFGVAHKEAIKNLKKNVDVLTLTATPIPRTLHMSLSGIKAMSLIEEPPEDRYPVQTYVMEQNSHIIRDAIEREIQRGGQVYVVYNRVRGIKRIADFIRELVPDAEVSVGHGQMSETALEDVIMGFSKHESDVLVATTIIESGIDIPNVNTMIVMDADRYGLSQLYQLRGRVGRSNRIAYAYLMYKKEKALSENAEKRLRAIREFTEFGAGFKIAMRDLEIRGAGNLLGAEQSGHMLDVGYELYCKLVEDAVKALQSGSAAVGADAPDDIEPTIELSTSALIPDYYIGDEMLKLQMYKKIAEIKDADDALDVTDELIDRFGDIPKETMNLIKISRIKSLAIKCGIERIAEKSDGSVVENARQKIEFQAASGRGPTPQGLAEAYEKFGNRIFIHGSAAASVKYTVDKKARLLDEVIDVLESLVV